MVEYRATKGKGKGQWWPLQANGRITATFICPDCGFEMILLHEINEDGVVYSTKYTSSVKCPYECGFHVSLILVGWKE